MVPSKVNRAICSLLLAIGQRGISPATSVGGFQQQFIAAQQCASYSTVAGAVTAGGSAVAPPHGAGSQHKLVLGTWLALLTVATGGLMVFGGITRLTRSGLSMTDWKFTGTMGPGLIQSLKRTKRTYSVSSTKQEPLCYANRDLQFTSPDLCNAHYHRKLGGGCSATMQRAKSLGGAIVALWTPSFRKMHLLYSF